MAIIICVLLGYMFSSFNPALRLGKKKNVDLREVGTGNPGASNTVLVLGKECGVLVMIVDVAKAFLSAKLARILFPKLIVGGMLAGLGAILGHMFPFYLNFRGGKGLAAYGGMVLAYDPRIFGFLVVSGVALMILCNVTVVVPLYVAAVFPMLIWLLGADPALVLVAALAGLALILRHRGNVRKAMNGEDLDVRAYLAGVFRKNEQ